MRSAGPLRNPRFRRLLVAEAVTSFGDWFTYVGISVIAIGQPRDELALAFVLIAHTAPRALLAPLAGALADRVDRRAMLVVATAARGAAALAMLGCVVAGWAWAVQGTFLLRMALGAFTDAAARAALPRLVAADELPAANALVGLQWSAMFIAGVGTGGLATAAFGVAAAFAIDAATFFVAAAGFATLPRIPAGGGPASRARRPRRSALSPTARRAVLAKVPVSIATGATWILLNRQAADHGAPAAALALGAVHVARALGSGLAPLLWPSRWCASVPGLHVSTALALVGAAGFAVADAAMLRWLCALVWGAGVGANWVTATTLVQTAVPDGTLGRAVALDGAFQATAQCLGGVVASIVAVGVGGALVGWCGIALAIATWLAIERLLRSAR